MAFTVKTPNSQFPWRPDLSVFSAVDVVPDSLVLTCSTVAGEIQGDAPSLRVAYLIDDEATVVEEAAQIPEAEPDLAEVQIFTAKISQLIRISAEQYGQPGTDQQLALSVQRALVKKADQLFLSAPAPTPPAMQPAVGVLNTPGIIDGGEVFDSLDVLIDAQAEIQANNGTRA